MAGKKVQQKSAGQIVSEVIPAPKGNSTIIALLGAVVLLAVLAIVGIVVLLLFGRPDDQSRNISTVVGLITAVITPILGGLVVLVNGQIKDLHHAINSRFTEFLEATKGQATAEAKVEGQDLLLAKIEEMEDKLREVQTKHAADVTAVQKAAYESGRTAGIEKMSPAPVAVQTVAEAAAAAADAASVAANTQAVNDNTIATVENTQVKAPPCREARPPSTTADD